MKSNVKMKIKIILNMKLIKLLKNIQVIKKDFMKKNLKEKSKKLKMNILQITEIKKIQDLRSLKICMKKKKI